MTKSAREHTGSVPSASWFESSARTRIANLVDPGSFVEIMGPTERRVSPHLALFDLPGQFDDGIITGTAALDGKRVFIVAQEGRFMGGAIGEVHGAKFLGMLRAAAERRSVPVVVLFDTGGVRLQEANAGELAISEIMRAMVEARDAGVTVVGLVGGRAGCYGGGSLIAGCCSYLVISEQGRLSVSGPEVIETNSGVEAFDASDRALVWRTMGGKHRFLIGAVDEFADDNAASFREAALRGIHNGRAFSRDELLAEHERLLKRIKDFGDTDDASNVWRRLGIAEPASVPGMDFEDFKTLANTHRSRNSHHEP